MVDGCCWLEADLSVVFGSWMSALAMVRQLNANDHARLITGTNLDILATTQVKATMLFLFEDGLSENTRRGVMNRKQSSSDLYVKYENSIAQRVAMTMAVGACVGLAWWLLLGGTGFVGPWLGRSWTPGDDIRRMCLAAMLAVYFARLLLTQFVFLKRAVGWSEVLMIVPWVLCIYLLLAVAGGTNPAPFGVVAGVGAVLFVLGSWINSYAEYARNVWKRQSENHGRLYTLGLFRYSRHPNYLGDMISFSGLCLVTGRWITIVIPSIMLAGFVFANIPMLDSHLHDHYGAAFDEYAARTRKLIPFVY
jgi:protein-S-isoprenylcysteine O-methyltransferase Ste14